MDTKYSIIIGIVAMTLFAAKTVSSQGIAILKQREELRLKKYKDIAGIWTVGYGHVILPSEKLDTITPEKAEQILRKDLKIAESVVNRYVSVPLTPGQFDALVSLVFNIGEGNFSGSTLLEKLNKYDYQGALAEFPRWNKARQNGELRVSQGLINRRKEEQEMFIA